MPFTPFHLGPGAAFKAVGDNRFSFLVFAGAQVLMDIEPLIRIIRGDAVLHGFTHTVAGAFLIGIVAALIGKFVGDIIPRLHCSITWLAAITGAFIGTFSHIALDAIMHSDMRPLYPFSNNNPLLGLLSVDALQVWCVGLGIIGALVIFVRFVARGKV